jgi:release factor glutamine methyltransferase
MTMDGGITVGEVLRRSTDHLAAKGCETPRLDAELLLAHALGLARIDLYMVLERRLRAAELDTARALLTRRAGREPVQHILGEWGFRRLTLRVDGRALIPRPETELVVERCLALLTRQVRPHVLDVGTGAGAIALALADEHPGARVTGIDISPDALALARENVELTGLEVELTEHDLFAGLPAGPWDLVVSNPPYIASANSDGLSPEVRDWDPHIALFAEDAVAAVARGAVPALRDGAALVLEVGDGQAADVAGLLTELGFRDVRVTPDLAGRERVVEGLR